MIAISAKDVTFKYKGQSRPLFSGLSFALKKGRIAAITGPSGSGKSTFACCLSRVIPDLLEGDYSGETEINGRVGVVFQDPEAQVFLPSVEDELAFAPENLCLPKEETGRRIRAVLRQLGIPHLRKANPAKLSGGQKQLVALGGVLTLKPEILIMDETLSQLDSHGRSRVKALLQELKAGGTAILLIEHEAQNYDIADDVWLLSEGKLQLLSSTEEVDVLA